MRQSYSIVIASPFTYENLVAEILVDEKYVGQVVQERSDGVFEFEIADTVGNQDMVCRKVEVDMLLAAIQEAIGKLQDKV